MPSELLNNYISNKPMAQASAILAAQPVQKTQSVRVDTTIKPDTFEKKTDKKPIAVIIAGALLLGGGFIILGKNGKLGEGVQGFLNKLFGGKTAESAVNSAQSAVQKTESATEGGVEKYLPPKIRPSKTNPETGEVLYRAQVLYEPSSVQADISNWAGLRRGLPKKSNLTSGDPINPFFNGFEIRPHNYADDTRVFVCARDYSRDYANYELENGLMKRVEGTIQGYMRGLGPSTAFEMQKNGRCLQAGHFDDGKKYVSFTYTNGEIYNGTRLGHETVTLVSNGTEFTQSQKDAIRIFKTIADDADPKTPVPMYFASATIGGAEISGTDSELVKRFNKNALLSAISSWAEHSPEFDVDKYIEKTGDTFRTGVKRAMFGNLNHPD